MDGLNSLPFNHYYCDEDFHNAISHFWHRNNKIDYDMINNLKFSIFDTNDKNANIPNNAYDPDIHMDMYRNAANNVLNVCNYYTDESFSKISMKFQNEFSLYHQNIRSLPAHIDELYAHLQGIDYKFKIIGLSETWLKDYNKEQYNIHGYNSVHNVRTQQKGGGVALLVDKNIEYKLRTDICECLTDVAEIVFIEISKNVFQTSKNLIIGELYKPPNTNINQFNTKLETLLTNLGNENAYCFLMGDFNINLINSDRHNDTNEFLNCFLSYSYMPLVNRPTRVTIHSATLIDNIFTNAVDIIDAETCVNGILYCDLTDHFPLFFMQQNKLGISKSRPTSEKIYKEIINSNTLNTLRQDLVEQNWSKVIETKCANDAYNEFEKVFSKSYKRCIPKKQITIKNNRKPWVTKGLLMSIKYKNKLYLQSIKNPCTITISRYKGYKNKLNHLLRITKKTYINDYLNKYSTDLKKSWALINNILHNKIKNRRMPTTMNIDNNMVDNSKKIANSFNEFYTNIGANLASKLSKSSTKPLHYSRQPRLGLATYSLFALWLCLFVCLFVCYSRQPPAGAGDV